QIALSESCHSLSISKIVPDLKALAEQNETKAQTPVLTARESEVMRLLAEGKTVREAADELSLSAKTVEAHKLNLMRKLDIHHRAALVAYAVQHGLVPASSIP
ncbi:MAG: response regulator transcription factor, partial [Acidobacteriaceae bacterium]|nr:response regulator transcription factor [Acidobacteriaceae bacterium]